MNKKEIIEKSLQKINFPDSKDSSKLLNIGCVFEGVAEDGSLMIMNVHGETDTYVYELVIYSKWFAKAFWGEELIDTPYVHYNESGEEGMTDYIPIKMVAWKWHLQQMVLEEELLKYLEKFL